MLGARTIRCGFKTRKAEHKTTQLIIGESAEHETTIMNGCNENMRRHYVDITARPYGALQFFNRRHGFRGFENFDDKVRHGLSGNTKIILESFDKLGVPRFMCQIV